MFKFKPTNKTYSDPVAATFVPGIPFGRKYSKGDICLLHDGFQASKIFLNSNVFREALLASKEFIEEICDIKITDRKDNNPKMDRTKAEVVEADVAVGMDIPTKPTSQMVFESIELEVKDNKDVDTSDLVFPELPGEDSTEVVIEGVDEIPEGAEVVDEVVIDAPAEVAEEIIEVIAPKKSRRTSKK